MSKKSIFFIILLFFLYFLFYSISYSFSISSDLKENLFRLHIIANSDSAEDQDLKLHVRDNLISYLQSFNFSNKTEMIKFLKDHQEDIYENVRNSIYEKGYNYDFSIEIGTSYFPKKDYADISTPSGFYDGIKIKIGKAEGKNWWCVLFPPMCLIDSTTCSFSEESEKILEENLQDETASLLYSQTPEYNFKFKIVDLFSNLVR